ncbi:MAG: hypothetical protein ACOVP8_09820, partial [Phycisphaerales bacterium]
MTTFPSSAASQPARSLRSAWRNIDSFNFVALVVAGGITMLLLATLGRVIQLQVAPSPQLQDEMSPRVTARASRSALICPVHQPRATQPPSGSCDARCSRVRSKNRATWSSSASLNKKRWPRTPPRVQRCVCVCVCVYQRVCFGVFVR